LIYIILTNPFALTINNESYTGVLKGSNQVWLDRYRYRCGRKYILLMPIHP